MSKIEWTGETWNPVTGCDKISPGCKNCYAETLAKRLKAMGQPNYANGFKVTLQPQMLEVPFKRKKPTMWFVNSMSDLFHKDIPDEFIDRVFGMMTLCPQHTFQILTKRPERMKDYMLRIEDAPDLIGYAAAYWVGFEDIPMYERWPPKHIWLGVSAENQKAADDRIPLLLETPAAVRFLSCEPLLSEVDLINFLPLKYQAGLRNNFVEGRLSGVDWVIVGGESGQNARPMHPDWARNLQKQCEAAGVSFFFKQWGSWAQGLGKGSASVWMTADGRVSNNAARDFQNVPFVQLSRHSKKKAGHLLDGKEYREFPK